MRWLNDKYYRNEGQSRHNFLQNRFYQLKHVLYTSNGNRVRVSSFK